MERAAYYRQLCKLSSRFIKPQVTDTPEKGPHRTLLVKVSSCFLEGSTKVKVDKEEYSKGI